MTQKKKTKPNCCHFEIVFHKMAVRERVFIHSFTYISFVRMGFYA